MNLELLDIRTWSLGTSIGFSAVIMLGLQVLSWIIPFAFSTTGAKLIPIKGKHLDEFNTTDNVFIFINKCLTIMFVYHMLWLCPQFSTIEWDMDKLSIFNTLGSMVLFVVFYDFFYATFHWILHFRSLYALIHKHHHRQKAPSRGNLDAINVHPFEFFCGEYLHLLTVYCIPCHIVTVIVFILAGGVFASLNHTRFDVVIPGLFSVKAHDVHHRLPESNYGQYTMLWDWLAGSYRAYDSKSAKAAKDE